jgi:hypothetical protein
MTTNSRPMIIDGYMDNRDLEREQLYESVKALVECDAPHIHLNQPKLFTLFSIAFQYMLFLSTKKPGHYIIRIEDSYLADKLQKKAKDQITRNFLQKILLPRKLKYNNSFFYIDFFHIGSWALTNELPKNKVMGALIVKNTTQAPLTTDEPTEDTPVVELPENFYLDSLLSFVPHTVTIAYEHKYDQLKVVNFPFIKEEKKVIKGVKIADHLDFDLETIED